MLIYFEVTDGGTHFYAPAHITKFLGPDFIMSASSFQNIVMYAFKSERTTIPTFFFGLYPGTMDTISPPYVRDWYIVNQTPHPNEPFTIRCKSADDEQMGELKVNIYFYDTLYNSYQMFDDGNHDDLLPGDRITESQFLYLTADCALTILLQKIKRVIHTRPPNPILVFQVCLEINIFFLISTKSVCRLTTKVY